MHPELTRELANERIETLRRAGALARLPERAARRPLDSDVVIRAARADEAASLAALAALDGTTAPAGGALVAEVGGSIRAALPLDGGRAFSDPFRRTSDLIALLEARAAQLAGGHDERRRHALGWLAPAALRRLV
jgi:hypothetical protein